MDITLVGFVVIAWIIHSVLAGAYSKLFSSTRSASFRLTHAAEIFLTVFLTIFIYKQGTEPTISSLSAVITVLSTLAVLDGVSMVTFKKLRERFDIGHFALAYTATTFAVLLAFWM